MPRVTIEFKKKNDGTAMLTFVRADGSRAASSIGPSHGYGPVHDLSHYAVESVLGLARGFIGLCGEGWTVQDFDRGAKDKVPEDAMVAEVIAGEVSRMKMMDQWSSLDDFNWTVARTSRTVTGAEYTAIRRAVTRLHAEWADLPVGETMSVVFEPGRASAVSAVGVMS